MGNCNQVKNCSLPGPNLWRMACITVMTRICRNHGAKVVKLRKKPIALARYVTRMTMPNS